MLAGPVRHALGYGSFTCALRAVSTRTSCTHRDWGPDAEIPCVGRRVHRFRQRWRPGPVRGQRQRVRHGRYVSLLLENNGEAKFADAARKAASSSAKRSMDAATPCWITTTMAAGHTDDGVGDRPFLLRNRCPLRNHWLKIELEATRGNRRAYGARIEIAAGDHVSARKPCARRVPHSGRFPRPFRTGQSDEAGPRRNPLARRSCTNPHKYLADQVLAVREPSMKTQLLILAVLASMGIVAATERQSLPRKPQTQNGESPQAGRLASRGNCRGSSDYVELIVERQSADNGARRSAEFERRTAPPVHARMLDTRRAASRAGRRVSYTLRSLWPIDRSHGRRPRLRKRD